MKPGPDNPPAFPVDPRNSVPSAWMPNGQGPNLHHWLGMTLWDHYAGQALAGLLAANATYGGRTNAHDLLALDAAGVADAMMAERKRRAESQP